MMKVVYSSERQTAKSESSIRAQEAQKREKSLILTRSMLLSALLCMATMVAVRFLLANSYTTDLVGIETNVIYSIQTILGGGKLYTPTDALPYAITQYTPLYYYLCAGTAWLLDFGPADVHELYLVGRLWNILINFLSVFAIYLIMRKVLKTNALLAAVAAFSSFVLQPSHEYAVRPDSLYDAFILWGIYFFLRYLSLKKSRQDVPEYLYIALCFAVASVFAKQSGIQLPILIGAFLVLTGNWRGVWFFILSSTVLFVCFSGFFWGMYGEAFLQNVVGGVANGISLDKFGRVILKLDNMRDFPLILVRLIIPAAIGVFLSLHRWLVFKGNLVERFFAFSILGTLAFAAVTALKVGSDVQYFYISFLLTFMFALYCFWKKTRVYAGNLLPAKYLQTGAAAYVCLLLLFNTVENLRWLKYEHWTEWSTGARDAMAVQKYLTREHGLQNGEYVFANVASEKREGINNFMFRQSVAPQLEILEFSTSPLKVFGYTNFCEQLTNGTIRYIIDSRPVYAFEVMPELKSIKQTYFTKVKSIGQYDIYKYDAAKADETGVLANSLP